MRQASRSTWASSGTRKEWTSFDLGLRCDFGQLGTSSPSAQSARWLGRKSQGLPLVSRLRNSARQLCGEAALLHDQVAAHVGDLRHVLDEDRAGLHAGPAGGARPERLVHDPPAHQGQLSSASSCRVVCAAVAPDRGQLLQRPALVVFGEVDAGRLQEVLLHVQDQLLGRQRLVGQPRGAGVLAAPALGAGVGVHQVLPPEVLDLGRAQRLLVLDPLLRCSVIGSIAPLGVRS